jgi:hypothetical protein
MAILMDKIECPNCGSEANTDLNYKTEEEYIFCCYCGYSKCVTVNTDNIKEITEVKRPYGAYRIFWKDDPAMESGTLETFEDFNTLKKKVYESIEDVELFLISKFKDGKITEKVIYEIKK